MGYYVNTTNVDFRIPGDKVDAAYKAVCDLNNNNSLKTGGVYPRSEGKEGANPDVWFSWMDWNYPETCPTLKDVLQQVGFDCYTEEDGTLVIINYNSKAGCEDVFLCALAPFAVADNPKYPAVIDWQGEDGEIWRNMVVDGKFYAQGLAVAPVGEPRLFEKSPRI